jgi:hypothetical protein
LPLFQSQKEISTQRHFQIWDGTKIIISLSGTWKLEKKRGKAASHQSLGGGRRRRMVGFQALGGFRRVGHVERL